MSGRTLIGAPSYHMDRLAPRLGDLGLRVDRLALGVLVDQVRVGRQQHRERVPELPGDLERLAALGEQQ